MIVFYHTN